MLRHFGTRWHEPSSVKRRSEPHDPQFTHWLETDMDSTRP